MRAKRRRIGESVGRPTVEAGGPLVPDAPIRSRGLTKVYGERTAVDRLDLDVRAGEIFGLLGQNGAGKTTTILMLLGLTEPTAGHARVAGLDPTRHPLEVKRRVGYLPDSVGFYGNLTGRENLRYTARLNAIPADLAEPRIDEVLEQVDLVERADTRTDTYSRGMLQRLGIADALVKDPEILILDEPTTSIDPLGVVDILRLLRRLVDERGLAILLSSHLLSQVQSVCDRVGIFADGRLIGLGTVDELAARFGGRAARLRVDLDPLSLVDETAFVARLGSIPGVTAVHPPDGPGSGWQVEVDPPDGRDDVRRAMLRLMADEAVPIVGIAALVPSLDDIYRRALIDNEIGGRAA
jgi:ABC-2 type transport system ATP-binding protein